MATRRTTNLLERDHDDIDAILRHPRQLAVVPRITQLLGGLRALRGPAEYFDFQTELFGDIYEAQLQQAKDSRNFKRSRTAQHLASNKEAELELAVSDRIVRQLRSVGDALAWRAFNFDRRMFLVLSQNAPVSPMVNKHGLNYELGEVVQIWRSQKHFALLHDLTNTLRIGDLTQFTPEGPRLIEVKSDASGPTAKQRERMQRAIDVINGSTKPFDEGRRSSLWSSSVQFRTHLKRFGEAISVADRDGISSVQITDQWVVSCLSIGSPALPETTDVAIRHSNELKQKTFKKARMDQAEHHLRGVGVVDRVGKSGSSAPLGIYPFHPNVCARLLCDYLSFETVITWERLAASFIDEGFGTECPLDERHDAPMDNQPALIITRGIAGLTIPGSGIHQVLYEFLNPRTYAAALREFFERRRPDEPFQFLFAFANERATWK